MKAEIRKIVTFVEETHREMERGVSPPTRRAAAVAVIANPFAGKYVDDLTPLMEIGEELGKLLTDQDYGGSAKACMDAIAQIVDSKVEEAGLL